MKALSVRLGVGAAIMVIGVAATVAGIFIGGGNSTTSVLLATSTWFVVGALIVVLRPGNAVGWLFSAAGLIWASGLALSGYAEEAGGGGLLTLASWYSEWFWLAGLFLIISSLYLFPTGRVPSPSWRPVLAVVGCGGVAAVVYAMLEPYVQASDSTPIVRNPIGIQGLPDIEDARVINHALFLLLVGGALAGAWSLVARYRRSRGVERQQLKLVALAGTIAVLGYIAAGSLDSLGLGNDLFWIPPFLAIPAGAGIAILRYQLFDVDRLISRTLVYGGLTVVLGAAYVGLVLGGQALFSSFAGGSNLAIAASTLVVAALFLPARARIQRAVDQRFYRRGYDTQRTLEEFGARLRDHVELGTLTTELRGVVSEAMQPSHVTVWRKGDAR